MSFLIKLHLCSLLSVAAIPIEAICEEFIFEVQNNTPTAMVALQIAENKINWHTFENVYIESSDSAKYYWTAEDGDNCQQYIRGYFEEFKWSEPVPVNFCSTQNVVIKFAKN